MAKKPHLPANLQPTILQPILQPILRSVRHEIKAYITMVVGLLMYAFGWITLLLPAKIVGGGVTGIGTIVFWLTGGADGLGGVPVGVTYAVVNAIFLTLGFIVIGPKFGAKTIFAILFTSTALTVMQRFIPRDLMGLAEDKLLSALLGGGLAGIGVGLCFSVGGSSGGTDIIAMIINKYRNISLGKLIMLFDVIIVGCSYFVLRDLPSVIYGYVVMFTLGNVVDFVLSGSKSSAQIMVFSRHYEEIAGRIMYEVHRGVTILDGTGAYSKQDQKILLIICRRAEASDIYRIIKAVDTQAFITQASVMGVFGQGFDALKTRK